MKPLFKRISVRDYHKEITNLEPIIDRSTIAPHVQLKLGYQNYRFSTTEDLLKAHINQMKKYMKTLPDIAGIKHDAIGYLSDVYSTSGICRLLDFKTDLNKINPLVLNSGRVEYKSFHSTVVDGGIDFLHLTNNWEHPWNFEVDNNNDLCKLITILTGNYNSNNSYLIYIVPDIDTPKEKAHLVIEECESVYFNLNDSMKNSYKYLTIYEITTNDISIKNRFILPESPSQTYQDIEEVNHE